MARQVAAVDAFNVGVAALAAALVDSDGQKRKKAK